MASKILCSMVVLLYTAAYGCQQQDLEPAQDRAKYDQTTTTTTHHHAKPSHAGHHTSHHDKEDAHDREVANMAISTLASMATSLVNIGSDAHNPQVVSSNVISILSSFINFITYALRHPQVIELLNDELFQEALRNYLITRIKDQQKYELECDELDHDILDQDTLEYGAEDIL